MSQGPAFTWVQEIQTRVFMVALGCHFPDRDMSLASLLVCGKPDNLS